MEYYEEMLEELKSKWDEIKLIMKDEFDIADVSFKTWILPLEIYEIENDVVTITTSEEQAARYMEKKYYSQLKVTISEVMNHEFDIRFISKNEVLTKKTSPVSSNNIGNINYEQSGLNRKYTFESFVVGDNNIMAHAASLAVAETPGDIYNPLFIYGGVGLGKTHLMHAIGNFISTNSPSLKVQYVSAEVFTNELIESIRSEKSSSNKSFRDKYRNVDVLLIDDIQFLIKREKTQEEFFHTFNTLISSKKQIVISSDRPPKEFDNIEERLKSRFASGLIVDLSSPNYETRMAILQKKADMERYSVNNEILDYIATNVKSNIRELEGALIKIIAYAKLTRKEVTLEFAEETLKDVISPNSNREITPQLIIQVVSDHYGITPNDISSSSRKSEHVLPRQVAMYLCRYMTDIPLEKIGMFMGGKDHSTIKYGVDKIHKEMKNSESLAMNIDIIKKKLSPS